MKCPICTTKKGKRSCQMTTSCICSSCCGTKRQAESCEGCSFYKPPRTTAASDGEDSQMTPEIKEELLNCFQSIIATHDYETNDEMNDSNAMNIINTIYNMCIGNNQKVTENLKDADPLVFSGVKRVTDFINNHSISRSYLMETFQEIRFLACDHIRNAIDERNYLEYLRLNIGVRLPNGDRIIMGNIEKEEKRQTLQEIAGNFAAMDRKGWRRWF